MAWGWAGLGAAVTFFALSPFLLVEPRTAWQDIVANRQIVVDRAAALGERAVPERSPPTAACCGRRASAGPVWAPPSSG